MLQATLDHLLPLPGGRPRYGPMPSAASASPQTRSHGPDEDPDPAAARQCGISPLETAFFKEHGFIVKRGLIPPETLAPFVDLFWTDVAPPCLDRSDPSTWVDPTQRPGWVPPENLRWAEIERRTGASIRRDPDATGKPELGSIPGVNRPYPAGFRNGSIKWTDVGGWPEFNDATSAHPAVLSTVQALIGGPIKRPHRNRGLYPNFPRSAGSDYLGSSESGLGPHNDTQPSELFGFVYLADVQPQSGVNTFCRL